MTWIGWILILTGPYPIVAAWRANRRTSLRDAVCWGGTAWLSWAGVGCHGSDLDALLIALCLTSCAGVAVLGARRPHVGAWNLVVFGLAFVMLLPLVERWMIGPRSLDLLRLTFLGATLAITTGNYIPTRFALAALVLAVGCVAGLVAAVSELSAWVGPTRLLALAVPHVAMLCRPRFAANSFDREWMAFRDRFGWLWSQRVREQFQQSAKHANLPGRLIWRGWRGESNSAPAAADILRGLTKRFMNNE